METFRASSQDSACQAGSQPRRRDSFGLSISDIRGIAQLTTEATTGVTGIVEGVHQSVWRTLGFPAGNAPGRTRGITGLIFKSIRNVILLIGKSTDTVLARLQTPSHAGDRIPPTSPRREAILAALNGVMGDRLAATGNPFRTLMTLRHKHAALHCHPFDRKSSERQSLGGRTLPPMPEATGKIVLLIHGLCRNDLQWRTEHEGRVVNHGEALASAWGYTPIYLRYNSGLHTSQNGRSLSACLEWLVDHWPTPIDELAVVAHSMGGLLIRSAVHYGQQDAMRWPNHLKNIVFLGTPHLGAPLERVGGWVDAVLGSTPYTAPFARLGRLRSAGITDLGYGYLLDEDWQCHERPDGKLVDRSSVPLPGNVACFSVAATTAAARSSLADRLIGDGLVPLNSALGHHDDPRRDLHFANESQWIAYRTNHMELLSSPEVTRQILHWLMPAKKTAGRRSERA